MHPHLTFALAQSHRQELLREAEHARRVAGLRAHPQFAAQLIRSILSSHGEQRPTAELPSTRPVATA
jgi:hypothetical protein